MMKFLIALFTLFYFSAVQAQSAPFVDQAKALKLSENNEWLALLHYKTRYLMTASEVKGDFFLSPNGGTDAKAELQATIEGLLSPASGFEVNQHPQCRFPARAKWLQKQINLPVVKANCVERDKFVSSLDAESASYVFSSYYLNSPASTFGHTFLRINKRTNSEADQERMELLDAGIGYGAVVTTENPVLYALFGLTGLFDGTFTREPYYYKVRQYNDFEARDLWSYQLALTPDELEMLVLHLWEIGSHRFTYFYLTRNCSYYLINLLDVAAPRLHLQDRVPFWVIPTDTVQAIAEVPGLVSKITYRPSSQKLFEKRVLALDPNQSQILQSLVESINKQSLESSELIFPEMPKEQQASLLDTATDYLDSRFPEEAAHPKTQAAAMKQKILAARARLGIRSDELILPPPQQNRADLGHGSARAGLSFGYSDRGHQFIQVSQRFAHHDPLDRFIGYPENAQIEFMHLNFRASNETPKLDVRSVDLIRVLNLSPWWAFQKSKSFHLSTGIRRLDSQACSYCHAAYLNGGAGFATYVLENPKLLPYFFLNTELNYATPIKDDFQLNLGPEIGFYFHPTENLRTQVAGAYYHSFFTEHKDEYKLKSEARLNLSRSFALNSKWERWREVDEVSAGFFYYY